MGGASALGQVITWSVTIVVARLLTPQDYGVVALSGLFTVFAQSVSEMGVGAAVVQREEISRAQIRTLYGFSLVVGGGMTLVGFLAGPIMAWFFNDDRLCTLVGFQSLVFLVSAAKSMQRNILVREARFDVIAKAEMASRVATSICTLFLAVSGCGYWAIAAQLMLIEFFQLIIFGSVERIVPSFRIKFVEIGGFVTFGVRVMARTIILQLYSMVDTAVLGKIASKTFLGAYGFSKQLANMPLEKIVRIVNQVLYPHMARNQSNLNLLKELTIMSADLQVLFIVPFYCLLFFCSQEVVLLLLGPGWSDAVFPLKIFCVSNIFKLAESYNMNCLTAMGKISVQIRYVLLLLIVVGGGILVAALVFDVRSSLFVWVSLYPVMCIFFSRVLLRAVNIRFQELFIRLRGTLTALAVMAVGLAMAEYCLQAELVFALCVKVTIGFVVYVSVLMLIDRSKIERVIYLFRPGVQR